MTEDEIRTRFSDLLDDIEERSAIAEGVVDKNYYRLYIATLWANVVLNPEDAGMEEDDLELLHEFVNERLVSILGLEESITGCFRFVNSKPGEQTMKDASLSKTHTDLLLYFSSMILDPEGHRRWIEDIEQQEDRRQ